MTAFPYLTVNSSDGKETARWYLQREVDSVIVLEMDGATPIHCHKLRVDV